MKYQDKYIQVQLPHGFSFLDRPNYAAWNFQGNNTLIFITFIEDPWAIELHIRNCKSSDDPDWTASGPHELELTHSRIVYCEAVRSINGKFFCKVVQILLRHADFSACIQINSETPFDLSMYMEFLDSIKASWEEIQETADTFIPVWKKELLDRVFASNFQVSSKKLPLRLAYLQPILNQLTLLSEKQLLDNKDELSTLTQEAWDQRLDSFTTDELDREVEADMVVLIHWFENYGQNEPAAQFIYDCLGG